nr:peritrophin-1 [Drosophila kikkawai]
MLPYANDCRKYYTCQNGQAYEHQCPANLYWSQLTYRCDYKEYSNCQPDEPANPINPFNPVSPVPSVQYSSFPGDCSRFYVTRVLRCEDDLQWSDQYQSCVAPQFSNCGVVIPVPSFPPVSPGTPMWPNGPAATPPPYDGTIAAPLPIDPNALCGNSLTNAYIPYPGDCHKFINCGPTATVLTCPGNLYWTPITLSCSVSSAGCQ